MSPDHVHSHVDERRLYHATVSCGRSHEVIAIGTMSPAYAITEGGYGGLCQRVAARHDVRLDVNIRSITRDRGVRVETDGGTIDADLLVLACPLDESLAFLDASAAERDLFPRSATTTTTWSPPRSPACPTSTTSPSSPTTPPERSGHPSCWYRRWRDTDLHVSSADHGRGSCRGPHPPRRDRRTQEDSFLPLSGPWRKRQSSWGLIPKRFAVPSTAARSAPRKSGDGGWLISHRLRPRANDDEPRPDRRHR